METDDELDRNEMVKKLQRLERIEDVLNRYWDLNHCYPGNTYWANEFLKASLKD